jgi:hypothetical protein
MPQETKSGSMRHKDGQGLYPKRRIQKGPYPKRRNQTSFNSEIGRVAGQRAWALTSEADRLERGLRFGDKRSLGGQRGSAATARYYHTLKPEDRTEKYIQILFAQAVARARAKGHLDPVFTRQEIYQPRPIAHPEGRPPKRNRWRDKKRAEREAQKNAQASSAEQSAQTAPARAVSTAPSTDRVDGRNRRARHR